MSCSLGTAKMPIILDQHETDSSSGSQNNFNIMDLVDKSRPQDRVQDGNYNTLSVDERFKEVQHLGVNSFDVTTRHNLSSSPREMIEENGKKEPPFKYLSNIFHTSDKMNHFSYEPVGSMSFSNGKSPVQSQIIADAPNVINKKYKRKVKSKTLNGDYPLFANPQSMQMNLIESENVSQPVFVMKNVKSKVAKSKKLNNKNKEKPNGVKKGYKLIAPYPTLPDEQQLLILQKPVQELINCNVASNVNPILIVKIEDEQLRLNDEVAKGNKLSDCCVEYENDKKSDDNFIQSSLLNDFEIFNKQKTHDFKNKKSDENKIKFCKCCNCPFMTLSKESLHYHMQDKEIKKCYNNNEVFHCPGCKNVFYSLTPLRVHLIHDHKMSQKDVKLLVRNIHEIHFESVENEQQKTSCAFETNQLILSENDFSSNVNNMEIPMQNIQSREEIHKNDFHDMPGGRHREMESCKRQTMLESYLDDISNKGSCSLPPPLTQNGSDLLENTFNFTAPVSEQLPSIQPPPAHSSSNTLDQTHLMDSTGNHSFLGMANVFPENRDQDQYKPDSEEHYADDANLMLTNENYLSSQVHDIPVINLDESHLVKPPSGMLAHDINIDDFSSYHDNGPGPLDDDDDDCRLSEEDEAQEEKKKIKNNGVGFRCDINGCKVRLQSEKNIQYHRRCHEGTLYNCPECCKDCSTWISLSSHLWQAHKIDMELYRCDQCPYKTPSYSRLTNIHRGIHGKARPFLCDICGKGFKTVKQMRNHKNIHKAKMVRMSVCHCETCGRTVADKRQLKLHINNTHKKKKPYLCYMCGYASAVKHSLVVHMRRHTGEKPYKCEKCDYKTADHNALRRHKMKHTGVRNYKCSHCTYTCIQASTYKVHIKTKHPGLEADIIFSCGQCNFQTLSRGSFLSHTSEHDGYNGSVRKQTRYHSLKSDAGQPSAPYYDSTRMDLAGPVISDRGVGNIVDLSGAQSLLEDLQFSRMERRL